MVKNARYIVLRINIIISSIFDGYETFIKAHIFSKTLKFFISQVLSSNDLQWPWMTIDDLEVNFSISDVKNVLSVYY